MKYGIIINGFWQTEALRWQVNELTRAMNSHGAEVDVLDTVNIRISIGGGEGMRADIGDYDGIIYLDKDMYIARILELSGYKLFNSALSIELCDDKMKTYIALSGRDIEMPLTIASPLIYAGEDKPEFIQSVIDTLGFSIIIKECFGSFGKQVYLAKDELRLSLLREKLLDKPHLYQRLVATSMGKDVRVIVVGGKTLCAMERSNPKDFRSNIELGGSGRVIELPKAFSDMAERAAKVLGLDYCGVDILYGEGGRPILCEVNSNAYFNAITRICGIDVADSYVRHILG